MSWANFGDPATFVRSPMLRKLESGRTVTASSPLNRRYGSTVGTLRGGKSAHGFGDGFDVRRRGAAAAADDVEPAVLRPFPELRRERFRRFRKTGRQQRIRQAGVRIRADINRREAGKFLDERTQFLRPQRAIHADGEQGNVGNGIPKRLDRLAGHAAIAARLDEGDGGEDGNTFLVGRVTA